jgi:hypothetical protein
MIEIKQSQSGTFKNKLVDTSVIVFLLSFIIFPNAFREIKLFFLLLLTPILASSIKHTLHPRLILWATIYLLIHSIAIIHGLQHNTDGDFISSIIGAYILAPVAWMLFGITLFYRLTPKLISKIFLIGLAAVCIQICGMFFLFDVIPDYVKEALIADANVTFIDGIPKVRLHAIASLVFLVPYVVLSRYFSIFTRVTFGVLSLGTIFIAGRTGVLMATSISIFVFLLIRLRDRKLLAVIGLFFVCVTALNFSGFLEKVDAGAIISEHFTKIINDIDDTRSAQRSELLRAFMENPLFGKGHGLSLNIIRDTEKPWRYELFYEANLFHVGIVGLFITFLPLYFSLWSIGFRGTSANLTDDRVAFAAGLLSGLIATATNPYLEGVELQWMYVIPAALALIQRPIYSNWAFRRRSIGVSDQSKRKHSGATET